jgi:hypothetical protein
MLAASNVPPAQGPGPLANPLRCTSRQAVPARGDFEGGEARSGRKVAPARRGGVAEDCSSTEGYAAA